MKEATARRSGSDRRARSRSAASPAQIAALHRRQARGLHDRINKLIGNHLAERRRVTENAEHLFARLRARRSGFPPPYSHQDPLADRDLFLEALSSLASGDTVRFTGRAGALVEERRYPIHIPGWKKIKAEKRKRRKLGRYETILQVPHPDHTGPHLKALSWGMAMWEKGGCVTFTLHLHERVIERARSSGHPAGYIHDLITKALQRHASRLAVSVPRLFLALEEGALEDLHVHGVIEVFSHAQGREAVRNALLQAAGYRPAGRTGREVKLVDPYWMPGWIDYLSKWVSTTELRLGAPAFAASNDVRTAGRDWYEAARQGERILIPQAKQAEAGLLDY